MLVNLYKIKSSLKRTGMLLAVSIFIAGIIISVMENPSLIRSMDVKWFLILAAIVPLSILFNALQFLSSSSLLRVNFTFRQSLSISILSTAANALPFPGGSAVRVLALKKDYNSYFDGLYATLCIASSWSGVALSISAFCLYFLSDGSISSKLILAIGLTASVVAFVFIFIKYSLSILTLFYIFLVQIIFVLIGIIRIIFSFNTLGYEINMLQAAVVNAANIISALVGFAPGGIGITEAAAGGIASYIGLSITAGFLAATINRLAGYIVVLPIAIMLNRLGNNN